LTIAEMKTWAREEAGKLGHTLGPWETWYDLRLVRAECQRCGAAYLIYPGKAAVWTKEPCPAREGA
jgi:hypothetical protein